MQVLGTAHLGRNFSQPAAIVQLRAVNLDEVNMIERDRIAILIDSPVNHETGFLGVRQIIHITLAKERLKPVIATAIAHVDRRVGKLGAAEGKHGVLDPQWPIRLGMESIAPHISVGGIRVVAGPMDVLDVVDEPPTGMGHALLVFIRLVVSHFKAMLAAVIGCTLDFVPPVAGTGHTVAVQVHTNHDNARLAAAARLIGHSGTLNSIAIDFHVIAVLIDNGMVKAEDDIAAKASQTDGSAHGFPAQRCLDQRIDAVLGVTWLIRGRLVHKLARCRQIVINMGDKGRILSHSRPCHHHCQNE